MLSKTVNILIIGILSLTLASQAYSGEIACSYYTDAPQKQAIADDIAGIFPEDAPDALNTITAAGSLLANAIHHDSFYCTYRQEGMSEDQSADEFNKLLTSKTIIPVFLFNGLTTKFHKEIMPKDIVRKGNNFSFSRTSVKSTINYFGFLDTRGGNLNLLLWKVSKYKGEAVPLQNYDWGIIKKYF